MLIIKTNNKEMEIIATDAVTEDGFEGGNKCYGVRMM